LKIKEEAFPLYEDECYEALRFDRLGKTARTNSSVTFSLEDLDYSDWFYTIHLSTQDKCNDTSSMCNRRFAYDTDY
jgi:hypothetical protein